MADYLKAFLKTKGKEGVYDNDVRDSGGETVWGITRRDHPKWSGWAIVEAQKARADFPTCLADVPELDAAVQAFYKPAYWDPVRGDEISDQGVAEELFDTAVNCGTKTAIILLQRLCNLGNRNQADFADLPEDGVFSNAVLSDLKSLLAKRGSAAVCKVLNALQAERYMEICRKDPTKKVYFWGWLLNRA